MPYFRGVARDALGNAVSGATVNVYLEGGTTAATIYSDAAQSSAATNPITTSTDGVYEFYIAAGIYDFSIAASGLTTVSITDVVIGQPCVDGYVTVLGTTALNAATYTTFAGGTWVDGTEGSGAFSHAGGAITYLGDAKVSVLVSINGVWASDANVDIKAGFGIDGADPTRPFEGIPMLAATDRTIGFSIILEVQKDEVITIEMIAASGTPAIGMVEGSTISAVIL